MNKIEQFKQDIKNIFENIDTPPFLFIGSGLSIRYYSIPTWLDLLKEFNLENRRSFKNEFGYYSSKCEKKPMDIASIMAKEFHEYWWNSEEFSENRSHYYETASVHIENAFKVELINFINSRKRLNPLMKDEINKLSNVVISGIITTNWDDLLEEIFPDFQRKVGQKEAIFTDYKSIGELYKIHGCASDPQSIVLTKDDYDKFILNNHYLNAKLLTIFAEYPIIFIGYSLNDPNIVSILQNLILSLDSELMQYEKLKDRIFFVEWQTSPCPPSVEKSSYNMKNISISLIKIKLHNFTELWEVLSEMPRKLSIKTVRQLQKMVYEFVSTTKPNGKMLVHGIEQLSEVDELEVVVGFGNISKLMNKGLLGLKVKDILEDILFDTISEINYTEIANNVLPSITKKKSFVPLFKYNKKINNLSFDNSLISCNYKSGDYLNTSKINIKSFQNEISNKTMKEIVKFNNLQELIESYSDIHSLQRLSHLEIEKIDSQVLRNFLVKLWPQYGIESNSYSSIYTKCICLLDFLENGNH